MLPNYLWDPARTNVRQKLLAVHQHEHDSSLLLSSDAAGEGGTSTGTSSTSKRAGSSSGPGLSWSCRSCCTSVALALPRTVLYVNLLASPFTLTLALEVAVLNTRLWEERARIATLLAFVFGLQEAIAYLTCRALTSTTTTSSSGNWRQGQGRRQGRSRCGLAGLRRLLQEVGASALCMIGLLASSVGTLLAIRGAKFLEAIALLYWIVGYGVLAGIGNGLVLVANTLALQHTAPAGTFPLHQ